jgi:hypothetical protein
MTRVWASSAEASGSGNGDEERRGYREGRRGSAGRGEGPGLLAALEPGDGRVVGVLCFGRRDVPAAVVAIRVRRGVLLRRVVSWRGGGAAGRKSRGCDGTANCLSNAKEDSS